MLNPPAGLESGDSFTDRSPPQARQEEAGGRREGRKEGRRRDHSALFKNEYPTRGGLRNKLCGEKHVFCVWGWAIPVHFHKTPQDGIRTSSLKPPRDKGFEKVWGGPTPLTGISVF